MIPKKPSMGNRILRVHGCVIGVLNNNDKRVVYVPDIPVTKIDPDLPLEQRKFVAGNAALLAIQYRFKFKGWNPFVVAVDPLIEQDKLCCNAPEVRQLVFECFQRGLRGFLKEGRLAGIYNQRRDEAQKVLDHIQLDKKHVSCGCHLCRTDAMILEARRKQRLIRFAPRFINALNPRHPEY